MPADFSIDTSAKVVLSRGWGTLSDRDLLDHQRRLRTHKDFVPGMSQLFDFREVEADTLTSMGIRNLAERNLFKKGAKRVFIVAQGKEALFGMLRMLEQYLGKHPIEVRVQYEDIEGAKRWLGLPTEQDLPE